MEFPDEVYRDVCSIRTLYSTTEGFFREFVRIVLEKTDSNWIEEVFKRAISEREKIRICCTDSKVWNTIQDVLQNATKVYRKKCAKASESSRLEGDRLCNKGDFRKAVMMYSQSVIRAPQSQRDELPESYSLSLAYKARANALFKMRQYHECLTDLSMALKEGFPVPLKYQIFRQMGECHAGLAELDKAKISLKIALKLIEDQLLKLEFTVVKDGTKADRNKDALLRNILAKEKEGIKEFLIRISTSGVEAKPDYDDLEVRYIGGPLPDLSGGPNENYGNASSLVGIKESLGAGRFAVATEKIDVGATLVVEEPQASCLIPRMLGSHCLHCFTRLYTPVPCKVCSGVAFCSVRCRDFATSSYHKYECEFLGLFLGSGMTVLSFLSLRMITQENLEFFKRLISKIEALNRGKESAAFSPRESHYMRVYNLTTHSHLRTGKDYFRRALMAIFLTKCLKGTDFFGSKDEKLETATFSEDEILVAAFVLHHLQLLQFNAHEIYETRVKKRGQTRDAKSVYIAIGIYPTVALFNHECAPSVTRYFNGKNIVIKAVRTLEKNEVLSENYGPHYAKKTLPDRIRELSSRYWFVCECRACAEDWPLIERLTERNFKIRCRTPKCRGTFSQTRSPKRSETNPMCDLCLKRTNISEVLKKKSQIEILFDKALDYMDAQSCSRAVPLLVSYLGEIFQSVSPPCREIFLAQEALRTCFAQTGNVWLLDEWQIESCTE